MAFHNVPPNGFPDIPDIEDLEAVEKDVKTLKTTTSEQGAAITALGTNKAPKTDIAAAFSAESNYEVGDLVYYEGALYECTTAHEAAAWSAEDFTAASVGSTISGVNSNLTNITRLEHYGYIDVYRNGVTVHIYLRSTSTKTPIDTNVLATNMPIPKGAESVHSIMTYYDGTSSQLGILTITEQGQITLMDKDSQSLTNVNYMGGELVYLVN